MDMATVLNPDQPIHTGTHAAQAAPARPWIYVIVFFAVAAVTIGAVVLLKALA
jgi:hypothetical protein